MQTVDVGGCRIAYRRGGSGPSVVLLHGGLEDSRIWADDIGRLSAHLDVTAWDAPGAGGSDDVPPEWSAGAWADTVAGFIRELGLRSPVLAGFSFGSVLALLAARDHPDLVRGLVLIGPYAGWRGSLPPAEVEARAASMRFTAVHPVDEWAEAFLDTVYAPNADPARRRRARGAIDDWRPTTTEAMLELMLVDLRSALTDIRVPTVVVRGERDARSPRKAALEIVESMPAASFVEIAGAGHDCAGPELDRVLVDFTRRLS